MERRTFLRVGTIALAGLGTGAGLSISSLADEAKVPPARRVTISGTIDGVDDENWPDKDQPCHHEFTQETILSDTQPQNVIKTEKKWGGECRVELRLTGQITDNRAVRITGVAELYEGTSENTNDLDGKITYDFLVPKGKTVTNSQTVKNTDEGGDYADIRITVTNVIVED